MKLLPSLFVLLSIAQSFAQIPTKAIALEDNAFDSYFLTRKIPVVKGKIFNLTPDEIKQTKIDCSIVTPFASFQQKKTIDLNADGTFEIKLDYAFPYQQVWMSAGDLFFTGLIVHDGLTIELDAKILKAQKEPMFNAQGVKYLGEDGKLTFYKNNHVLYKRKTQLDINRQLQMLRTKKLTSEVYLAKYDSLFALLKTIDADFIAQNPPELAWVIVNERESEYLSDLLVHHFFKSMPNVLYEKIQRHKPYLVSNDGMLFYQYYLMYLEMQYAKTRSKDVTKETLKRVKFLDSLFTPAKSDLFKLRLSGKDPIEHNKVLEIVLPSVKTNWCRWVLEAEQKKASEKMLAVTKMLQEAKPVNEGKELGKPIAQFAFGAQLYKVDSTNAEALLSKLKNAFPGKALYIDMWATWCGPCLHEFPFSKKLHDEVAGLPVEFIYFCTSEGSDVEKWKIKVAEFELQGTHIFVDKKIAGKILEIFSGSGFPTYAMINTKGEYKPGVPRPSGLSKDTMAEWIKNTN